MTSNQLDFASSPYLEHHKDNPVNWYSWGKPAFIKAKAEDKPIFLSIGYSACHWCHVMARESFENPEIAKILNDHFISVKVDREEHLDVDLYYQAALQILGQAGGWPLSMFLTPEGIPFWGGTYFPPEARYGRPGFAEILNLVATAYKRGDDAVSKNAKALERELSALAQTQIGPLARADACLLTAAETLLGYYDTDFGGFGSAPKFPQPQVLKLVWQAWQRSRNQAFLDAFLSSLRHMVHGGIYDHLGGGFARYTVDRAWRIPHFEKMLYDNAQILELLCHAYQETGEELWQRKAEETVAWLLDDMLIPGTKGKFSGFASSLDADSQGVEGKYYTWREEEIDAVLGEDAALFKQAYAVVPEGNWEGVNILYRANTHAQPSSSEEKHLHSLRKKLLAQRRKRPKPFRDDKVLADWNGLMIRALALASLTFSNESWQRLSEDAFSFVIEEMTQNGQLFHAWRQGKAHVPGYLDDYAAMTLAALSLYEMTSKKVYFDHAQNFSTVMKDHFYDGEKSALGQESRDKGGFFMTAEFPFESTTAKNNISPAVMLPHPIKPVFDQATPSGNALSIEAFSRLFHLSGLPTYRQIAEVSLTAFARLLTNPQPFSVASLILAYDLLANPSEVVIVSKDEEAIKEIKHILGRQPLVNLVCLFVDSTQNLPEHHPAFKKTQEGDLTVYICQGQSCSLPLHTPTEVRTYFEN